MRKYEQTIVHPESKRGKLLLESSPPLALIQRWRADLGLNDDAQSISCNSAAKIVSRYTRPGCLGVRGHRFDGPKPPTDKLHGSTAEYQGAGIRKPRQTRCVGVGT